LLYHKTSNKRLWRLFVHLTNPTRHLMETRRLFETRHLFVSYTNVKILVPVRQGK